MTLPLFPYMSVKGIRDIFAGLVVLSFLLKGDRRTTAALFAIAILIPVGDGFVILRHLGFAQPDVLPGLSSVLV